MKANNDLCFWSMMILAFAVALKGYTIAASVYYVGAMLFKVICGLKETKND